MRLFVYSYFPVLTNYQFGGAQQIMHDLLSGFAAAGLDVTVICPESNDRDLLPCRDNLRVLPVLKSVINRALFPYERFYNWQQIREYAQQADLIWTLDNSFPFDVPQPIVLTLDQFSYTEEMESLLSLTWDVLALSSRYLYNIANVLVGPAYWDGEAPSIALLPYGIDTHLFTKSDPEALCRRLGLSKSEPYLLFPHRPDPEKGFSVALKTLALLNAQSVYYKLLIPLNMNFKADKRYYNLVASQAQRMGIGSLMLFHEWIPLNDLPAYFSLGRGTLALGTFPEGFGLTPVQSISCGTPVISTRAGALDQQFPPEHGVRYVDFDAADQVALYAQNMPLEAELSRGRAFVEEHYSVDRLVREYLDCFRKARKRTGHYNPLRTSDLPRLSPWCRLLGDATIWHDYRMKKYRLTKKEADLVGYIERGVSPPADEDYRLQVANLRMRGVLLA
jgi:glycosyltransferase involved in cell wall biosynthesis